MDIFANPWVIGIGTAVIAGLVLYFVFGIGKPKRKHQLDKPAAITQHDIQQNAQAALPSVSVEKGKSNITANEIYEYLKSLPPLQRDTAALNYKGIKVSWKVNLSYGFHQRSGELNLGMRDKEHNSVYCNIDDALYPELKIIKSDQEFIVEGEITEAHLGGITLKNCRLFF